MKYQFKKILNNLPIIETMKFNTKERNILVCSDPHYSHKNIIKKLTSWEKGATREFESVEHHNDILVANINNTVKKDDVLFMLGDIAFGGFENIEVFMKRILCDEIHLIFGNHDEHIINNRNNVKNSFTTTSFYREVQIDGNTFVMFHYPISEWNGAHKGFYHIYGHQHNLPQDKFSNIGRSMDIGFDGHPEFRPYNIKEVINVLKDKSFIKHH